MPLSALARWLTYQGVPLWRNVRVLQAAAQVAFAVIVVTVAVFLVSNVLEAARDRGLSMGFGFLDQTAGFPISESVVPYEESNSFIYAFYVGILNMLKVSLIGIVAATLLGIFIGVCRLSTNWLVNRLAAAYIETFRNIPLLVQLFFWYFAVFQALPPVQESLRGPGPVFVNNRGIFLPWAEASGSFGPWLLFLVAGIALAVGAHFGLRRLPGSIARAPYVQVAPAVILVALVVLGWFLTAEPPLSREAPALGTFNFEGGLRLTPEFAALLIGLVVYTASFIAEIVRAGIQSVPRGQVEAARALGMKDFQMLRTVVFPQALRAIVPPLISQYLNLTKNSSLAIAIGYPDVFAIGRIMINQAGRAVPVFLLIMAAYMVMSLIYAAIGNLYNRRGMRYLRRSD